MTLINPLISFNTQTPQDPRFSLPSNPTFSSICIPFPKPTMLNPAHFTSPPQIPPTIQKDISHSSSSATPPTPAPKANLDDKVPFDPVNIDSLRERPINKFG